jgi:hypothetical protein
VWFFLFFFSLLVVVLVLVLVVLVSNKKFHWLLTCRTGGLEVIVLPGEFKLTYIVIVVDVVSRNERLNECNFWQVVFDGSVLLTGQFVCR